MGRHYNMEQVRRPANNKSIVLKLSGTKALMNTEIIHFSRLQKNIDVEMMFEMFNLNLNENEKNF